MDSGCLAVAFDFLCASFVNSALVLIELDQFTVYKFPSLLPK
jgi:hypothetical protein